MSKISEWLTQARSTKHPENQVDQQDELRAIDALKALLIGGQSSAPSMSQVSNMDAEQVSYLYGEL